MGRSAGRVAAMFLLPSVLWLFLGVLVGHSSPVASAPRVVISEVAWGGTAANSADEWLELYSNTDAQVDLGGWNLSSEDGGLSIGLTGTIAAGGFYLLERTDDNTILDLSADQIYTGGLLNSGERLVLQDENGHVVDTANGDGGPWPAGSAAPLYLSMERLDAELFDGDSNWVNNNQVIRNGLDADGHPINGTPGQPNGAWSHTGGDVLIEAVLYDGYELNDADEAVLLRNMGSQPVSLAGWVLSDGTDDAPLPLGADLAPGEHLWLAADGAAFQRQFGFPPQADLAISWPGYANSGDEVVLWDSVGGLVDVLVYGAGDVTRQGWDGPALQPYLAGSLFAAEGQILYRMRGQKSGIFGPDTDTAEDWAQSREDPINGRRIRYPGWDLDRFFFTAQVTQTAILTVSIAPDNALQAILRQIESAQTSLRIESLSLENLTIGEALADASDRGVEVTILLEGSPAGGLTDQERYVCAQIEAAGGACWFMIADDAEHIADRYRNLHAKFIMVDDARVIVGSENLSPDSLPDDEKSDGTWGRRGAFLITDAPGVVSHLADVFAADLDPEAHVDLFRWTANHAVYGAPPAGFVPITLTGGTTYTIRFPEAVAFTGRFPFEIVQSPENSLRDQDSLLGLIARVGADDTLLVQQLNERLFWGAGDSNSFDDPNLRLEAYIAAARRGARVRLLLDSYFPVSNENYGNPATCRYVNDTADVEGLDLACRQANPTGLGIHNKMVLAEIDGRGWVHVGSLNGTEQSSKGNREIALQVQSDGAYLLLARLFQLDWPHRNYMPAMILDTGRANYVLISEILYDPSGLDDAEFIELANPTRQAVDLTNWSIGDAVHPDDFEDVRLFPPGTVLPSRSVLVIATTATGYYLVYGRNPDFEIVDSDSTVPDLIDDPNWGDPAALLQLGNAGDEVLLRNALGEVTDVVAYGAGSYPGTTSCSLVVAADHSLERFPYWLDTNDCLQDFRDWPFPNPGELP